MSIHGATGLRGGGGADPERPNPSNCGGAQRLIAVARAARRTGRVSHSAHGHTLGLVQPREAVDVYRLGNPSK